jgi:hypothetical protein
LPNISKINAVDIGNIAKVDGATSSNIAKVDGLDFVTFTGLLDTYTGAEVAFSVRRLASATTVLMRVRRDSDNVEADIGFDSNNEFGLTSPVSNPSSGGPFTDFADFIGHGGTPANGFCRYWYDQSGNGIDLSQSTAGNQPKIYDSSAGIIEEGSVGFEKPALSFVANRFENQTIAVNENNIGVYCVSRGGGTLSTFQTAVDLGVTVGTSAVLLGYRTSQIYISGTTAGTINDTSHLLSSVYGDSTANEAKGFRNGTELINTTTTSSSITALKVANTQSIAGTEWNGTIQEIVIWGTSTKSDDTAIRNNLNGFFTIY